VKPFISVVTPTFHREDLLARCVQSVLAQQVDAPFEHLVVNGYGEPLAPAPWMDDPRVRVLSTFRTERCVARNTGAALSQGQWLLFLDDDDALLPGAFASMLQAAQAADPVLVYGGYEIHNERLGRSDTLQPQVPADVFPLLFVGEVLPPQATWLRRDAFFQAGCFDPTFPAAEDVDLIRRVAFLGACAGTTHVTASVRVEHQTTTSHWARQNEFTHASLEKNLRLPATLPRLLASTQGQPTGGDAAPANMSPRPGGCGRRGSAEPPWRVCPGPRAWRGGMRDARLFCAACAADLLPKPPISCLVRCAPLQGCVRLASASHRHSHGFSPAYRRRNSLFRRRNALGMPRESRNSA